MASALLSFLIWCFFAPVASAFTTSIPSFAEPVAEGFIQSMGASPASFPTSMSGLPWVTGSFYQPEDLAGPRCWIPSTKLSWTDEFLDQIRMAQQAVDMEPDDAMPEAAEEDTIDNLAALHQLGGFRHWMIYRPHRLGPALHTHLELRVQPTTTIMRISMAS